MVVVAWTYAWVFVITAIFAYVTGDRVERNAVHGETPAHRYLQRLATRRAAKWRKLAHMAGILAVITNIAAIIMAVMGVGNV